VTPGQHLIDVSREGAWRLDGTQIQELDCGFSPIDTARHGSQPAGVSEHSPRRDLLSRHRALTLTIAVIGVALCAYAAKFVIVPIPAGHPTIRQILSDLRMLAALVGPGLLAWVIARLVVAGGGRSVGSMTLRLYGAWAAITSLFLIVVQFGPFVPSPPMCLGGFGICEAFYDTWRASLPPVVAWWSDHYLQVFLASWIVSLIVVTAALIRAQMRAALRPDEDQHL
jgi:hypothetical protein